MKIRSVGMRIVSLAFAVVAALFCASVIFFAAPGQAWADEVSTPDEFVAKAADPTVTSIEITTDMDMSGKHFIDVSGKTIDLGGHVISNDNFSFGLQGSDFTVENGTFEVNGGGSYALFIGDSIATDDVVVENVTCRGGINVYNSTNVVLRNVDVTGTGYYAVWCDEAAQVTIESGSFTSPGPAVLGLATGDNDQKMTIEGGSFTTAEGKPLVNEQNGAAALPVITGGIFDTTDVARYCSDGFAVLGDSGSLEVMSEEVAAGQAAAVVDGVYYKNADEAEQAAGAGGGMVIPSYRVVFTGEGVTDSFVFVDENEVIAPPTLTPREGYVFDGWYNGAAKWNFATDKVTEPMTLVAQWSKVQPVVPPTGGSGTSGVEGASGSESDKLVLAQTGDTQGIVFAACGVAALASTSALVFARCKSSK